MTCSAALLLSQTPAVLCRRPELDLSKNKNSVGWSSGVNSWTPFNTVAKRAQDKPPIICSAPANSSGTLPELDPPKNKNSMGWSNTVAKRCVALLPDYMFCSGGKLPGNLEPELTGRVFQNVINVHTLRQEPDQTVGNDHRVSDVYCNQCGNILGIKIIEGPSNSELREGDFILRRPKLKMWNGHQIVDTEEP
ncbi:uncharacterized protein LOC130770050 [Actinidia eriantha]|uniref:uncharacterized protein LOC130770050 n=1 Tax=Actinidia eriantha TaxID=165200 RepID=UPI00258F0918|nr:uncharacterized protein LOC130770050 [Actinidia eriantha]